jgi:hypothetical protein
MKQKTLIAAAILLLCPALQAQTSNPWFEIELIAFERQSAPAAKEQFGKEITPIALPHALDLFKALYQPDTYALSQALPVCGAAATDEPSDFSTEVQLNTLATDLVAELAQAQRSLARYRQQWPASPMLYWREACRPGVPQPDVPALTDWTAPPEQPAGPLMLPTIPPVVSPVVHQNSPYLVDETALQLKDLAWQLSHRGGHKLLLHTAWRLPLGPKQQSRQLRVFAGQRFSPQFDYFGDQQAAPTVATDTDSLHQAIEQTYRQLQQGRQLNPAGNTANLRGLPQQVWQLDGMIRPYNQRMLFADTEFNFRQLSAGGEQLHTFYSKENVRLLLGELHYLDHPKFGLILQIRRFTPPTSEVAVP